MFGATTQQLRTDLTRLNRSTQRLWGVSALMFRTAKFVFQIAVLAFTVYLIEATSISTLVALGVAILFISGPEGLELYLIRQDILPSTRFDDD